jgi:hypothetical protein
MKSIIELLKASQDDLFKMLEKLDGVSSKAEGSFIIWDKEPNKYKPMICVHLDTINTHAELVKLEFIEANRIIACGNKQMSCLGGDDRAGVWIALQLIEYMNSTKDYKYSIGFFCDEEVGCRGSGNYVTLNDKFDENVTAFIGLDRRSPKGKQEVALYGCDNDKLSEMFIKLGYKEAFGSVTDASALAQYCEIACINLSIGYDNEHTNREVLYIDCMVDTLNHLKKLPYLGEKFTYEPSYNSNMFGGYYQDYGSIKDEIYTPAICDWCANHAPLYYVEDELLCADCLKDLEGLYYDEDER